MITICYSLFFLNLDGGRDEESNTGFDLGAGIVLTY